MIARRPHDHRTIFLPNPCDFRKISARPPHDAPTKFLRATVLRTFQICHKSSLNKIVEDTASVNPYRNRTIAADSAQKSHGTRVGSARRLHDKGAIRAVYGLHRLIASQM